MEAPIRILHLEDNENDALLVQLELEKADIRCEITRVQSRAEYTSLLQTTTFDLIISDYSLPSMDGLTGLEIAREKAPETPFIFVSGTIGEETAIESLRHGATDYILKDRMVRLVPAIHRAMQEEASRKERKQNDKRIREQAALLDKAQDGIIVLRMDHTISYWNKGAENIYEWTASEVLGKHFDELTSERSMQVEDAYLRVKKNGEWMGEYRSFTKSRKEVILQSRWSLIRDDDGNPQSILMINTDITASKKLEALFLRAQRMENLGTLAGGIAHDLNNILGPILLAVQMIGKKLTDPQSQRLLQTLEESAKRGADMVKQILGFARGVSGEHVPLAIKHLLNEVRRMIEDTFPPTISIDTAIETRLRSIMGDATQLHQVLINLCINARDSMPQGGRLTMSAKNTTVDEHFAQLHKPATAGPYVEITISDTGVGMTPEVRARIFEPFFTTKEFGKGTGLGLSTALGIVKNHHGFLVVRSAEGKGSSFTLYLPAVEAATEAKNSAPSPRIKGQGELILVIDDEEPILEITKSTLEGCGFKVQTAIDGTDGVALFAQHKEDIKLVIVDMVMPFMDGPSTIKAIQKLRPDSRFIAVSGLEEYGRIIGMGTQGSISFLQKPYTMDKLLEVMEEVFGTS